MDGTTVTDTRSSTGITLGVGKGGQGDKLAMPIKSCDSGMIEFVATFFGPDVDGDVCEVTRRLTKTCK